MACRKCKREIPDDSVFCPWCGIRQEKKSGTRKKGNGTGYAYKRGSTWTACVTIGFYTDKSGVVHRKYRTKGGFPTKTDATNYCQSLFVSTKANSTMTMQEVYDKWHDEHESRVGSTTIKGYSAAYKWFSRLHYIQMRLIKATDLQQCIDECPRGKRVKEDMKTVAGLLYKWAYNNDVVDKNYAINLFKRNTASVYDGRG